MAPAKPNTAQSSSVSAPADIAITRRSSSLTPIVNLRSPRRSRSRRLSFARHRCSPAVARIVALKRAAGAPRIAQRPCSTQGAIPRGRRRSTGFCQRLPYRWTARGPYRCVARGRRPKSVEGRDLDGDHPRQSNRARQCRRNQIRWARSAQRERAALLRSANARSRRKFFRWFGNCQRSIAIHRLLEPSLFFSGLGQRHKAVRQQASGGREVADVLRALLLLAQLHLGISCDLEA
jgi:hypothetical protein